MTDFSNLDRSLQVLRERADAWVDLPLADRIRYLEEIFDGTHAVAHRQVAKATQAKSITIDEPAAAEEYFGGPVVQLRTIRQLIETLKRIQKTGKVQFPNSVRDTGLGQIAAKVFPTRTIDKVLFSGFSAEVWLDSSVTASNLEDHLGYMYRERPKTGAVSLVLGAGNVASIGPLDVVHKLFVEGQVCMLKMNPVNDYLGPFVEETFGRLIQDGFVQVVYGGADVGKYLCEHAEVDEIHITGSDKTHDAIVFGVGEAGEARKRNNEPQNDKRITSELGNVSPIVVVPGSWTQTELRFQAENVATQMTNNGGFNCNAAKMIIVWEEWAQKRDFMDMLASVLAEIPQRVAYYPGAFQRYEHFVSKHASPIKVGDQDDKHLPWTLLPDVSIDESGVPFFTEESFCGVTAQTNLPASDARSFLANAVEFCNEKLWGTLNACILVDPRTEKQLGGSLDAAVAKLKYGSIGINHWPAICYGLGSTTWGAFPGHTLDDIQSGIGVVHNTYLLESVEKSVMRGPFVSSPKPPWFVTHANAHHVAQKMVDLEHRPSYWKLPGVAFQAFRG
jgi:hypothetical protein